ncbi:MAG: PilZ domain-containing protein [Deltaproteobacteria bacterium]|nr:PilZ domain-containing protein [Deltaproteobacteria bacterium]
MRTPTDDGLPTGDGFPTDKLRKGACEMTQKDSDERREYVRAVLSTSVRVKPITREEFDQITAIQTAADRTDPVALVRSESADSTTDRNLIYLTEWLIKIDDKLNRILQKLDGEQQESDVAVVGETKDVSGAGVSLLISEPWEVGQLVQVTLNMPGYSMGPLKAYGEISRVTPTMKDDETVYEIAVDFKFISESEREKLIAYSFYQQRKAIREALDNDDNPTVE